MVVVVGIREDVRLAVEDKSGGLDLLFQELGVDAVQFVNIPISRAGLRLMIDDPVNAAGPGSSSSRSSLMM